MRLKTLMTQLCTRRAHYYRKRTSHRHVKSFLYALITNPAKQGAARRNPYATNIRPIVFLSYNTDKASRSAEFQ